MKIFDLQADKVLVNENVLLISWLKKVYDKYGIPGLCYIHYMTHPDSPYSTQPEDIIEDKIREDHPGDYVSDDPSILTAIEKLENFYDTPVTRFFKAQAKAMDKVSTYLSITEIDDDPKEGNAMSYNRFQTNAAKTLQNYQMAEKAKDAEKLKARGNNKIAYDQ